MTSFDRVWLKDGHKVRDVRRREVSSADRTGFLTAANAEGVRDCLIAREGPELVFRHLPSGRTILIPWDAVLFGEPAEPAANTNGEAPRKAAAK